MMPEIDGLSLLEQVKESHPGLPLIFLTAVHDRAVADAAIRAGARDYLLKPFDRDRLLAAVDDILGVNRNSPELEQLLPQGSSTESGFRWYGIGYWICWVLTFIATWIYCIATYGFLLGVGLGWLPSAITASVVSLAWPLLVIGVVAVIAYILSR